MRSPALRLLLVAGCCQIWLHDSLAAGAEPRAAAKASAVSVSAAPAADYAWTTDHLQIGVRWQPFAGRPQNNAFDAARPVIATDSSYAQFWVAWNAAEPTVANTDYAQNQSAYLQTIEQA
ncbi:hypothetical protein EBU58_11345, partial [bacterium]|nr:hypothetical protein [bacterium]